MMKRRFSCVFLVLALLLGLCACAQGVSTWQEQYDLGIRYLSEGKYEEAILAFAAAIEIDPMQAETYLNLADAYWALGSLDFALQTLRDGYAATGDTRLLARIDELTAPEPTPASTPTPAPSVTVIASGVCGENVTWTLDSSDTLTISGTGPMKDFDLDDIQPWHEYVIGKTIMVVIEDGITHIGSKAFWNETLAQVDMIIMNIPNSVTSIGDEAFSGCKMSDVDIPDSVISIGESSFAVCDMTNVIIPDSVTSLGYNAFGGNYMTSVTISNNVTSIEGSTFFGCTNLTSVTIPDSVAAIGIVAFYHCNSLTDVYYSGSEEQWNQIIIDRDNDPLLSAAIHYNS